MTDYLEFEGKTIDQALEKASQQVGQPADIIEYDVISYGSSGIFGLVGVKQAKIRVKNKQPKIPQEIQRTARQQARDLVNDAFQVEEPPEAVESAPSASTGTAGGIYLRRHHHSKRIQQRSPAVQGGRRK